jgi:hypothetical protein
VDTSTVPPTKYDEVHRAVREIMDTVSAHVRLRAEELQIAPEALLRHLIARAEKGLLPDRRHPPGTGS